MKKRKLVNTYHIIFKFKRYNGSYEIECVDKAHMIRTYRKCQDYLVHKQIMTTSNDIEEEGWDISIDITEILYIKCETRGHWEWE